MNRIGCFVDGYNLYHAIDGLKDNKLKWLNIRKLVNHFIDPIRDTIQFIEYFSAYATHLPDSYHRHKLYVNALRSEGIIPFLGKFKKKPNAAINAMHNGCLMKKKNQTFVFQFVYSKKRY